jgi:multiple sugar transport system ATP-binding protein
LRVQRQPRAVIQHKVEHIAALVQLQDLLQRKPAQLSGGQQQRVALGRALIKEPDLLLFDEPLSNLDAELRLHMRAEIKRLQRSLGITAVLVTHDQTEALSMADRILVLREGRLQQLADPHTLYHAPANEFVARFIGSAPMNFLPVQPAGHPPMLQLVDTAFCFALPATTWATMECGLPSARHYTLGLRPEHILLQPAPGEHLLPATITLLEPLGREVLVSVTCGPHLLKVLVPAPCLLALDTPVWLNLSQGPHHVFDPHTGVALVQR